MVSRVYHALSFSIAAFGLTACGLDRKDLPVSQAVVSPNVFSRIETAEATVLDSLPQGADSIADACSPPGTDGLTNANALCATPTPKITSLADLRALLHLTIDPRKGNGANGNPGFVLLGHSSSLVARFVTSINPRSIVFTSGVNSPNPKNPYNILSYTRGEQFAEIATYDPPANAVNFYLVTFKKACNLTSSCAPADLLGPDAEKDWVSFSVYEDDAHGDALGNTIIDCQQCHQRNGPDSPPILRFQEIAPPYTHSFWSQSEGGAALVADYLAAHGTSEAYAGIPGTLISKSDPALFAQFITTAGFGAQPNAFPSTTIERDVKASSPDQPSNNAIEGSSPTWASLLEGFVQGQFIPPPWHDVKVTDPGRLAELSRAYREFADGRRPASLIPDTREAIKDDAEFEVGTGFRAKPGLDGRAIIVNACAQCHNPQLDQQISRSRFNAVDIEMNTLGERSVASVRIQEPEDSARLMPPLRFRVLSADEKAAVAAYLTGN